MATTPAQRRILLGHPAGWIATGFACGLSPMAPGTVGSLVALIPWLALRQLGWPLYLVVLLAAFTLGVWGCAWAVRRTGVDDPGFAVWDEFVGQWIALLPLVVAPRPWLWILCGFILFRLFDIWKPWPVSWADRTVKGGLGVMLDDVLAGGYAAVVLWLLSVLIH